MILSGGTNGNSVAVANDDLSETLTQQFQLTMTIHRKPWPDSGLALMVA